MKNRGKRAHLTRKNGDRAPHFPRNERESAPAARSEAEKSGQRRRDKKSVQRKRGAAGGAEDGRRVRLLCRASRANLPQSFRAQSSPFMLCVCRRLFRETEKGGRKALPSPFGDNTVFRLRKIRTPSENQTMPCAIIASATLRNPAMFAPATKLPFIPYFSHASETFL